MPRWGCVSIVINRKKSGGAPRMASGGPAWTLDQMESERAQRALATERRARAEESITKKRGSGQETRREEDITQPRRCGAILRLSALVRPYLGQASALGGSSRSAI